MKLLGDFFHIIDVPVDGTCSWRIKLNADHIIYKSHFPDNPITPGVCLIQIITELMESKTLLRLELKKVRNVKFLSVLSPVNNDEVTVLVKKITVDGNEYKVQAVVYDDSVQFAKISVVYEAIR